MVSVYKCIDMTLLPEEYLPDEFEEETIGTLEEITGKNKSLHMLNKSCVLENVV